MFIWSSFNRKLFVHRKHTFRLIFSISTKKSELLRYYSRSIEIMLFFSIAQGYTHLYASCKANPANSMMSRCQTTDSNVRYIFYCTYKMAILNKSRHPLTRSFKFTSPLWLTSCQGDFIQFA